MAISPPIRVQLGLDGNRRQSGPTLRDTAADILRVSMRHDSFRAAVGSARCHVVARFVCLLSGVRSTECWAIIDLRIAQSKDCKDDTTHAYQDFFEVPRFNATR